MKTLYLCRHAKSSWADPGMDDFDRPLNERGQRNAPFMAGLFKERGEPVDLIVSSPANRALTTAKAFASALHLPADRFKQDRNIYLAERQTEALDRIAADEGISRAEVIRRLLDRALERLRAHSDRLSRVVECRYFAGYSEEETAEALGVSLRTAQRDWLRARAWLRQELDRGGAEPGA